MSKFSKRLLVILLMLALTACATVTCLAAVNVNGGVYSPFWSEQWVTPETQGMWKGFYIKKADNTLRTDLIARSGGEWGIPGEQYSMVWEGVNAVGPSDTSDVGYLLNCIEGGKIEIFLKGRMDVPGCTEINVGIYKNNFNTLIWPEDGKEATVGDGGSIDVNTLCTVKQGDKIFFKFHSPVEVANSPQFRFVDFKVIWRSSDQQQQTPSQVVDVPSDVVTSKPSKPDTNPTTSSTANKPSENKPANTEPSQTETPGSNDTTPSEEPDNGGIVIVDDDSYYLTSRYEDVTVDEKNNAVTLSRKLTLKDFMDSFNIKTGCTIKVIDTETTMEVTEESTLITDKMICRVFNQGTPVTNISINTDYKAASPAQNGSGSSGVPIVLIVVIGVIALVLGAGIMFLILMLLKKKKS